MADPLSRVFSAALSGVPTWPQAVVADFIDEGHFATHIRTMRQHYKKRHETLHTEKRPLEDHLDIQRASSGFHTVGFFKDARHDEDDFVQAATKLGVTLSAIGRYCLAPIDRKGVVIGYGAASEAEIRQGMKSLSQFFA